MPSHRQYRRLQRSITLNALLMDTLERKPSRARDRDANHLRARLEKVEKLLKHPKPLPKGELAADLAEDCGVAKADALAFLDSFAALGTKEVKKTGLFIIPGLARLKIKALPQRTAGKAQLFGKAVMKKGYPSRQILKAFPVPALKRSLGCKSKSSKTHGGGASTRGRGASTRGRGASTRGGARM